MAKRRKMSALQRKYFGGGRKKRAAGKKRRQTVVVATANPVRRRRRRSLSGGRRVSRRRYFAKNPVSRRHRRRSSSSKRRFFRRNPVIDGMNLGRMASDVVLPGIAGAALADWVYSQVSNSSMLPAQLQSGLGDAIVRLGIPIVLGMIGNSVLGGNAGAAIATGGLIIEGYTLLQSGVLNGGSGSAWNAWQALGSGSGNGMGRAGFYSPMGRYLGKYAGGRRVGMGFLKGVAPIGIQNRRARMPRLGYVGPARTVKGLGRYLGRRRYARG